MYKGWNLLYVYDLPIRQIRLNNIQMTAVFKRDNLNFKTQDSEKRYAIIVMEEKLQNLTYWIYCLHYRSIILQCKSAYPCSCLVINFSSHTKLGVGAICNS